MQPYAYGYQRPAEINWCRLFNRYDSCTLQHGTDYCAVVQASSHGMDGPRVRSTHVLRACLSAPATGFAVETAGAGYADDLDYSASGQLSIRWGGFFDDCAGIAAYRATVRVWHANSSRWQPILQTTLNGTTYAWSVALPQPGFHRSSICGVAASGLESCARTDGIHYDDTPPNGGHICVRVGASQQCGGRAFLGPRDWNEYPIRITWFGFTDVESGIQAFRWAVAGYSFATGGQWTDAGIATAAVLPALGLNDTSIRITVEATNGAGIVANVSTLFQYDDTPPHVQPDALRIGWQPPGILPQHSTHESPRKPRANPAQTPRKPRQLLHKTANGAHHISADLCRAQVTSTRRACYSSATRRSLGSRPSRAV